MNFKSIRLILLSGFVSLFLTSCGGESGTNSSTTIFVNTGLAQKGPFSIGSTVTVTKLDEFGISTGSVVQAKVSSNNGSFRYETDGVDTKAYYRIQAKGRFLNENTGIISEDQINLSAITNNPKNSSVNLVTHWITQRTDELLASDKSLEASLDQSQKELLKIFGIKNANALDVTSSSPLLNKDLDSDNALLLLLSGALMEASQKYEVDSQTIIDEIGDDFKDDGKLSVKGDDWFIQLQSQIKDNPRLHTKKYAKQIRDKFGYNVSLENKLPALIPLASRPVANLPPELLAEPGETITLDGSASHDSGDIINFTWFRVDQQTQYNVQVSDRFSATPTITVPNEATVLSAPNQEISLLYALVVTDADKLTHTGVIKITIKTPPPLNIPPVAESQTLITDEDIPIAITLNASDIDGNSSINFVLSTPLSTPNGIVTVDSALPNVLYTPSQDYFGTDSFTFIVNDGFANSNTATVEIEVNSVNDPPLADAGPDQIVTSLETVSLDGSGSSDVDGTIIEYTWEQQLPASSLVTLLSNTIVNPSFEAPEVLSTPEILTFNLVVTDNDSVSSIVDSVVITINPMNEPPLANAGLNQNVITGETVTLEGSGTDIDGTIVSYQWSHSYGNSLTLSSTSVANPTFIAPAVSSSAVTYTINLIVTDDDGAQSPASSVNIIVNPLVNIPPTAEDLSIPINLVSTNTSINLIGNDPDGDNAKLVYDILTNPLFGDTNPSVGVIPNNGNTTEYQSFSVPSPDSFTYRVRDELGAVSNTATISLILANNIPTANSFSVGTNQGVAITIPESSTEIGGFDFDGDILTVIDVTQPSNGTLDTSTYTYTPNATFFGTDSFTYKVNDGTEDSVIATVTINVNARPIADAGFNQTVTQGDNVTLSGFSSRDPDGTITVFEWSQRLSDLDQVMPFNNANTENPNFTAPTINTSDPNKILNFDLFVTDNDNFRSLVNSVTIIVTENCQPTPPSAFTGVNRNVVSGTDVTLYGSVIVGNNCDPGYEGFPVVEWSQLDVPPDPDVGLVSNPFGGSPEFTAPIVNVITELRFQLIATDDVTGIPSDPAIMTVTVHPDASSLPPNDPPIATSNSDDYNIEVLGNGDSQFIRLRADDPDGDNQGLTYRIDSTPSNGNLNIGFSSDGSSVTYVPNYPVAAIDSFNFIATDQNGLESAPIKVNISRISEPAGNNAPIAIGGTFTGRSIDSRLTIEIENDNLVSETDVDDFYTLIEVNKIENNLMFEEPVDNFFSGFSMRVNHVVLPDPALRVPASGEYEFIAVDKYGRESANTKFIVNFNGPNPPTAIPGADRVVAPGEVLTLFGNATDIDGTVSRRFGYEWTQTQGTTVSISGSSTPNPTFTSPNISTGTEILVFELIVEDDEGYESVPESIQITVDVNATLNNRPTANSFTINVNQNSSIIIPQGLGELGGNDTDGDALTITISRFPSSSRGELIIENSGSGDIYTYTPLLDYCGRDSFTYYVSDGRVISRTRTVTINVNCPPEATDLGDFTIELSGTPIVLSGTDEEGAIVSYQIVTLPTNGTFDTSEILPNLLYIPNNTSSPLSDQFSFVVFDEGGLPSTPQLVNLFAGNGVPITNSGRIVIPTGDTEATIDLNNFSNDPDNDSLIFEIIGNISTFNFTLSDTFITDGIVTGRNSSTRFPRSFQFRVTDSNGAKSNISTMEIISE